MTTAIPTRAPFSFDQTLAFIRRFPPCRDEVIVGDACGPGASARGGRGGPFAIGRGRVVAAPAGSPPALARRAADFVGADDDLTALSAAAPDAPPFRAVVR